MDIRYDRTSILIDGMTCSSCELKVEKTLKKLEGVLDVKVSLAKGKAEISYDKEKISIAEMIRAIDEVGYKAAEENENASSSIDSKISGRFFSKTKNNSDTLSIDQMLGIGIIILALYIIIKHTIGFNFIPEIDQNMGYGVLFVVGALTSLHCIAMCGGINLSQCVSHAHAADDKMGKLKPSLLYNAGRVVSYTLIGGIVGTIGKVVSFSGAAKGLVAVFAGVFMIIMGINMLNIFPWLKRFNISMPKFIGRKIYSGKTNRGPFIIGLLNGFMPCGPLQAMQLYALGTGSFVKGAASMFFFSMGTVPLMFGLGAISTILSKRFTGKLMKVSAVLVVILGVGMISRGMSLSGFNTVVAAPKNSSVAVVSGNVQTVSIDLASNKYQAITVQKGVPVRFIINAREENINGCNSPIVIPQFGIQKEIRPGQNIIEFTPDKTGTIPYSCWMGMIRSSIKVVDDVTQETDAPAAEDINAQPAAGGCCGSEVPAKTLDQTAEEDIYIAKTINGVQEVKVAVDEAGFSPNIIVVQKNIPTKFVFDPKALNQCNYAVVFPEYQGGLDLSKGDLETPELEVTEDFGFTCWMGMMKAYVKVVDDINKVDLEEVKILAQRYSPTSTSSGGCH